MGSVSYRGEKIKNLLAPYFLQSILLKKNFLGINGAEK